uniref:(northern house mosquito) hypothetical protein n=1 Tax=Culex pipiens TaxID=7175 RepID=A0A8D8NTF8_CULPI
MARLFQHTIYNIYKTNSKTNTKKINHSSLQSKIKNTLFTIIQPCFSIAPSPTLIGLDSARLAIGKFRVSQHVTLRLHLGCPLTGHVTSRLEVGGEAESRMQFGGGEEVVPEIQFRQHLAEKKTR